MTLTTRFVISDPLALPKEVFDYCQEIIGTVNPQWKHEQPNQKYEWDVNPAFRNNIGQGFDALLWVKYGADGPLMEWDWDKNESVEYKPFGYIEVSFDTAYSYTGPNNESCSQLHSSYIKKLGKWCEEKKWKYQWQDEYTGEWFNDYRFADSLGI